MNAKIDRTRPCFDCGGLNGHHTKNCDLMDEGGIADLPSAPNTQWWTQSPAGKYFIDHGGRNVAMKFIPPLNVIRNQFTNLPGAGAFVDTEKNQ